MFLDYVKKGDIELVESYNSHAILTGKVNINEYT